MENILPFTNIKLLVFNKTNNKAIISDNSFVKLLILDTSKVINVLDNGNILKIMFDNYDNILVLTNKNLIIYEYIHTISLNSLNIKKNISSSNSLRNNSKNDFVTASINGEKLILVHGNSSIDIYSTNNYNILDKLDTSLYTNSTNSNSIHARNNSKINMISLNNDSTKIVYEILNGMIMNIFNIITKKKVKTIQIDIAGVNRENRKNKYCVFSLDNNFIIEIYKNQIKYFNIGSGLLQNTVTFLTDFIVLSPKQDIVVGYDSSKIKIFNINGDEISFPIDNAFSVYKIVFCPDGNKIALISSEHISIFNIQKGITNHTKLWNMVIRENRQPLTKALIDASLSSQNKKIILQKFIAKILSNYSYFKTYLEKNDLIGKFNTTHFMNIILNSTLNLHQNDFSMFINNIIKFINSTPYKVILGQDQNASMLIKYYLNIIREYLLYLYYHYQKEVSRPRNFRINDVEHNHELNILIANMAEPSVYLSNLLNIKYKGEYGINMGGLTKTFLTAVETQLNSNLLKTIIPSPEQRLDYKINILAISKINNNPITIINDKVLKKKIILIITSYFKSVIKKNIVYKLLFNENIADPSPSFLMSYGSNNTSDYELSGNIEYSGTPSDEKLFNNSLHSIYKLSIDKLSIDSNFTPTHFINNRESNNINSGNNSENNSRNNSNSRNISFKIYIDSLIERGIYKNYLDFYLSHFLEVKVNKVLLIDRLTFGNRSGMVDFNRFKTNFIKLIETLDDSEILLFNNAISGSNLLQQQYTILVLNQTQGSDELWPTYHTCFNRMDIESYISFSTHYLKLDSTGKIENECKRKFMRSVNFVVQSGYGAA